MPEAGAAIAAWAGTTTGTVALTTAAGLAASAALAPKAPSVTAPPPLQTPNGDAAAAAVANRAKGAAGFGSTNVTGPTGLTDPATTAPKTLLGG